MDKGLKNLLGGDLKSGLAYYLGLLTILPAFCLMILLAILSMQGARITGWTITLFVLSLPAWIFGIFCFVKECCAKPKNVSAILHSLVPVILGGITFLTFIAIMIILAFIVKH